MTPTSTLDVQACIEYSRCDEKNAGTNILAKGHLSINSRRLALGAASLQRKGDEKELSVRTPRSLTTFVICLESSGVAVPKDNRKGQCKNELLMVKSENGIVELIEK